MKVWRIGLLCLALGLVDVGIPYLFLADVGKFWGGYLLWSVLSLAVIIGGAWHVSKWGEDK